MAEGVAAPGTGAGAGVLKKRVIFGLTMAAAVIGLIWLDFRLGTSWGVATLAAVALLMGMRELHRMLDAVVPGAPVLWKGAGQAAAALMVAAHAVEHEVLRAPALGPALPLGDAVTAAFVLALLAGQLRHEPTRERIASIALTLFGVVYILVLGSYALKCRYLPPAGGREIGATAFFYLLFAGKGTDVFAFFTGRALGRTKLIPWISPGKTRAGLAGGLAGAVAITAAFAHLSSLGAVLGWRAVVPFGIIMGLGSVAGDLVESLIKRGAAVKDSGGLVPEFGGVLDIVDSVLFSAPVLYVGVLVLG